MPSHRSADRQRSGFPPRSTCASNVKERNQGGSPKYLTWWLVHHVPLISQQDSRLQLQVSAQCSGIHGLGLRASWIFWISLDFFEFWMLEVPRGFYSDTNECKQTGSKQLIKDGDVLDGIAVWTTVSVFYCWCWLLGQVLILSNLYWCPFRQINHITCWQHLCNRK